MLDGKESLDVGCEDQIQPHAADLNDQSRVEHSGFDRELIVRASLRTIQRAQKQVQQDVAVDPASAFEQLSIGARKKPLLAIDLVTERNAARELHRALPDYPLLVLGEESLRDQNLDLTGEKRLVALVDMIDGTDLLERGLFNWCSAIVFYFPPERRILAAFIGIPDHAIYFALDSLTYPRKYQLKGSPLILPVAGPSRVQTIENSSLAFYGQKLAHFSSIAKGPFFSYLARLQERHCRTGRELKTRIYNLAGNPIAMRLIDGTRRVDALFDLQGQLPHDIVPGAFIATKAGASFRDLEGRSIDLNEALLRPADRHKPMRYVLAATEELSLELRRCLVGAPRESQHPHPIAA
jgi:fructose-1,6-bisphosphatase/inositol monophosphatase family enzyme